jgi:hypothetical protein
VTFFARSWLDRLLGRGASARDEAPAQRARVLEAEESAREPESLADVEEGATAARDDSIPRHTPMPPPGTG